MEGFSEKEGARSDVWFRELCSLCGSSFEQRRASYSPLAQLVGEAVSLGREGGEPELQQNNGREMRQAVVQGVILIDLITLAFLFFHTSSILI